MNQDYNEFGLVGENLTIDDFNEKEIYIGDELKIGNCLFQISQPRIPCYKIGIKMNSRDFPKKFSQSGLLGSYLRVLETGSISKNDEIEYIRKESDSLSVYEIAEILFKDVNNIDQMKKAIDLKYLTEEIKERFRERLMKLGDFSSL
jgi:MOSC domain-containing protein YiiM